MRRMRSILLAVVLLAGLVSCGNGGGPDGVKIYYAVRGAEGYEQAAIQSENWSDAPEEVTMDDLFPRLLTPPVDDGRYVVFPENVRLLGWTLEEGLLTVDLSESYSELTGISLTLANYCLVLSAGCLRRAALRRGRLSPVLCPGRENIRKTPCFAPQKGQTWQNRY